MNEEKKALQQQLMMDYIHSENSYERERLLAKALKAFRPVLVYSVQRHLSFIPSSDREDYYQIGEIVIWKILERLRREKIEIEFFPSYIWAAMRNTYVREFYKYIEKYPVRIREHESIYSGEETTARMFFMTEYLEKYKEKKSEYQRRYRESRKMRAQIQA